MKRTVLGLVLGFWAVAAGAQTTAQAWHRWEKRLVTARDYQGTVAAPDNPYRKLALPVQLTPLSCTGSPWCQPFGGYGFWDGGREFVIRGSFPVGSWRWTVSCTGTSGGSNCATDPVLNQTGTVTVTDSNLAEPPLLQKGLPRVHSSQRFLTYGDSVTPLRWQADTAWFAAINDNPSNTRWDTFLNDRVAKGFTAVLLAPAPSDDNATVATQTLFEDIPQSGVTCTGNTAWPKTCSRWRPPYWRNLEEKINRANEKGLLVVLVGIMDPQGNPQMPRRYPDPLAAEVFARNLSARLAGNHVIFSPPFDDSLTSLTETLMDKVAAGLQAGAPRQLRTAHLLGGSSVCDYFKIHSLKGWHQLHLFQSGHGKVTTQCPNLTTFPCAMYRARTFPQLLLEGSTPANCTGFTPVTRKRPAANAEAAYDQGPPPASATQPVVDTPFGVRQTSYYSALNGAFGVTLGAKGIWDWTDVSTGKLNSDGAKQMRILGQQFNLQPWQFLRPEYGRIKGQPAAEEQKAVMAATADNNFAMLYLPNNAEVKFDATFLTGFTCDQRTWQISWIDPKNGLPVRNTTPRCTQLVNDPSGATRKLARPACAQNADMGGCDFLIVLRRKGTYGAPATAPPPLDVWSQEAEDASGWQVWAQPKDSEGLPLGDPIQVGGSASPDLPLKGAVTVYDFEGGSLIAWESEDDGDGHGIYLRRLDETGEFALPEARINLTQTFDQTNPWLAVHPFRGGGLATWTSYGQDQDQGGIYARLFDSAGLPFGPEIAISQNPAGHQDFSKSGIDGDGNFTVAWTRSPSEEPGPSQVYFRRFDRSGVPLGSEKRVGESISGGESQYLTHLEVASAGDFVVTWTVYDEDGEMKELLSQHFDPSGLTTAPPYRADVAE